jgi:hypothetical protein
MSHLYPWTHEPLPPFWSKAVESAGLTGIYDALWSLSESADEPIEQRSHYLNVPFAIVRAIVYFTAWLTLSFRMRRLAARVRRSGSDPAIVARAQGNSAGGLVIVALTFTFFAIDWVMSLEAEWFSTIYGALLGTGSAVVGLSIAILFTAAYGAPASRSESPSQQTLNDLGSLLLAFLMLWAYMAFSQYLIVWSGNQPTEITWYLARGSNGWGGVAAAVFILHFAVPFLLLLSRDVKRNPRALATLAGGLLVVHYVEVIWIVVPSLPEAGRHFDWLDLAVPIAFAGIWLGWFARKFRQRIEEETQANG